MNTDGSRLESFFDKATSGDIPAWVLGGLAILLAVIALKVGKGILRLILFLFALAAVTGAIVWHIQHR